MIEKTIYIKAKASPQPPLGIKKINSKYPNSYGFVKKNETNRDYWDGDKNKFTQNLFTTNINQLWVQTSTKDKNKCYEENCQGHPAIKINTTQVIKKKK